MTARLRTLRASSGHGEGAVREKENRRALAQPLPRRITPVQYRVSNTSAGLSEFLGPNFALVSAQVDMPWLTLMDIGRGREDMHRRFALEVISPSRQHHGMNPASTNSLVRRPQPSIARFHRDPSKPIARHGRRESESMEVVIVSRRHCKSKSERQGRADQVGMDKGPMAEMLRW